MKSGNHLPLALACSLLLAASLPSRAEILAAWETTGQQSYGTENLAPSSSGAGLVVGGLTRGPGVDISGTTAPEDAWGGRGWDAASIDAAVADGNYITFTVTPAAGVELSIESLSLNYRRNPDGPVAAALQFQLGDGGFVEVEELPFDNVTAAGDTVGGIDLTGYGELQGFTGQTVTFRLVPYGAAGPDGSLFIHGPLAGDDLVLEGVIAGSSGGDTTPPLVTGRVPADNATNLPAATATPLSLTFNENIARGTGMIVVRKSSDGTPLQTFDAADPAAVTVAVNQIGLVITNPLAPGTSYHVEIPAGAFVDLAVPPNPFAGFTASGDWNFSTAAVVLPPRVVVNKYVNGSPDRVELLVIGNGVPGATVDLRGMILKDFSGEMNGDGGGKFVFAASPLWAAVPVGTLITLNNAAASPDPVAGDFKVSVGLTDPVHFTPVAGSPAFDLSATDMVMIKEAGSDPAGTSGGIHALAAGVAGPTSFFTLFPGAKLRSAGTTGIHLGVAAGNSTGSQSDYMSGTDATGELALALGDFGAPNNGPNAGYISALRGWTPGDGDGVANLVNATLSSPFLGLSMFDRAQTGQSAKLTLVPRIAGVTLTTVRIVVPPILGAPGGATLAGPGAEGAGISIEGQTIDISSASVTTTRPLEITIADLATPFPTGAGDDGNYPLVVSTASHGGTLTPIATQAAVRVIISIIPLRESDLDGGALAAGAVVAVEGTVTEADFGGGAANFSGFIQDETAGINVFSPSTFLGLLRGYRFAVAGTVVQSNGLTGIVPLSAAHLVNRGPVPEARSVAVPLAKLLAHPEAYEGKLVSVRKLTHGSGLWGPGATLTLLDHALVPIEIRIQSGSTATEPPPYPATITGIFGQADAASPFTSGYQLMPRDPADVRAWVDDFAAWATETGATGGPDDDDDDDGRDNAFEYAFGLDPLAGDDAGPVIAAPNPLTGKFRYTRRAQTLTETGHRYLTSTNLVDWTEDIRAVESVISGNSRIETVEVTLSAAKPLAAPRLFLRVATE
jgi:hypothetical protein